MSRRDEEHKIQSAIIKATEHIPECEWLHAIPNGGKRSAATGARLKAEGVKPGVLDLFLPVPVVILDKRYTCGISATSKLLFATKCGLYIEVKTENGRLTKEQRKFINHCKSNGYAYTVVRSAQEGVDAILEYLGKKG